MDRWELFHILLRDGDMTVREIEKAITTMGRKELEEGVMEYLVVRKRLKEIEECERIAQQNCAHR